MLSCVWNCGYNIQFSYNFVSIRFVSFGEWSEEEKNSITISVCCTAIHSINDSVNKRSVDCKDNNCTNSFFRSNLNCFCSWQGIETAPNYHRLMNLRDDNGRLHTIPICVLYIIGMCTLHCALKAHALCVFVWVWAWPNLGVFFDLLPILLGCAEIFVLKLKSFLMRIFSANSIIFFCIINIKI